MEFCVLGMDYHHAPIEVRETVHFKDTDKIAFTDAMGRQGLEEMVILSTCNRMEIYFMARDPEQGWNQLVQGLKEYFSIEDPEPYLSFIQGDQGLRHLFTVAMGLDSMVVGEDQILGQVKDAYRTAMELGSAKKRIHRIFQTVISFGKTVKAKSGSSDQPVSMAYIGVKAAEKAFSGLEGRQVTVIGLGNMGKLAARHFMEAGAHVTVSNRTIANSRKMKDEFPQITIVDYTDRQEAINGADVLVTATSSPHTIIVPKSVGQRDRPLFILDLSLPRDVDPRTGELPCVELMDIDRLQSVAEENLKERRRRLEEFIPELEKTIDALGKEEVDALVDPVLKTLNQRCDDIAEDTLSYIFRKVEMSHSQKMKVDKIVRSSLKKVLREPILTIRAMEDREKKREAIAFLEEVFHQ